MLTVTISGRVKNSDASMLRSIAYEAIGLVGGNNFGGEAFWDSNPEWSNESWDELTA